MFRIEIPVWVASLLGAAILAQMIAMAAVEKNYHNQRDLGYIHVGLGSGAQQFFGFVSMISLGIVMFYLVRQGEEVLFTALALIVILVGFLFKLNLPQPQRDCDSIIIVALAILMIYRLAEPSGLLDKLLPFRSNQSGGRP